MENKENICTTGEIFSSVVWSIVWIDKKIDPKKITSDAVDILNRCNELMQSHEEYSNRKIGLVYWRVQSGKTNAMIATTALAFDNGYKIAIILTSNNVSLVKQTKDRFSRKFNLTGSFYVTTYKYQDLQDSEEIERFITRDQERIIIVVPKWSKALNELIECLGNLNNRNYKTIIFDDEWDNYSLDNNRKKRDSDEEIEPTAINNKIFTELRDKVQHVLVSVTGTPQWILMEWTNEQLGFKYLLEPGDGYAGGDVFFYESDPHGSPYVTVFDLNNRDTVDSDKDEDISESIKEVLLESLICFFVLATFYHHDTGNFWEFLCHPSQKNKIHNQFKRLIKNDYWMKILEEVESGKQNPNSPIINKVQKFYNKYITEKWKNISLPDWLDLFFDLFLNLLLKNIRNTNIIQFNAKQKDEKEEGKFHIIIGGNILGRGVTIDNLLVMFYGRNSKTTNMDTLYQHARMFWYRRKMLNYMHIYMPDIVYDKFHATYQTDEWLRNQIKKDPYNKFPIQVRSIGNSGLRFTRESIQSKTSLSDVFSPYRQFYPNIITEQEHKLNSKTYNQIKSKLASFVIQSDFESDSYYASHSKVSNVDSYLSAYLPKEGVIGGVLVDISEVAEILKLIKTSSDNKWGKKDFPIKILESLLLDEEDKRIRIYINNAKTRRWNNGVIKGVLSWRNIDSHMKDPNIILYLSNLEYPEYKNLWTMYYPTIIFPEKFSRIGKVYVMK